MNPATLDAASPVKTPLWDHQHDALAFAHGKQGVLLAHEMGCLPGDAVITVNRGGNARRMHIADVVDKFEGVWAQRPDIATHVRGLRDDDGSLGRVALTAVHRNGEKPLLTICTSGGRRLRCTAEHEIVTPRGKARAGSLALGDELLVDAHPGRLRTGAGRQRQRGESLGAGRYRDQDGYVRVWNTGHPREGTGGMYEHIIVAEEKIGRRVRDGEHVHHVDGDRSNNTPANLAVMPADEHLRHHGDRGHFPGAHPQVDRVAYILRSAKPEPVYDLTVDDPAHAYVADGIVVGNSGKSLTTIAMLEQRQAMRVLILCPKSVVAVWPDQLHQHAARAWDTWAGRVNGARGPLSNPTVARRAAALIKADTDAIKLRRPFAAVVNYEASIAKPMDDLLLGTPWDALILDESHRIKAPGGKQSRLAAKIAQRVRDRGGVVLGLSGTPMSHSPLDLYAQLRAIDGGATLGTNYAGFCRRYGAPKTIFAPGGVQRLIYEGIRPGMADAFAEQIAGVVHQCSPDLGLPDITDVYRTFEMSPKAQRAYDLLEAQGIAELDEGVITAGNAMVVVLRLAQATGGFGVDADTGDPFALDGTPGKATLLRDVLEDIPPDEPVVVFCRFHTDLNAVRDVAEGMRRTYAELSGRRRDALDGPRLREGVQIAGVQVKSGGTGIDLTRARYGIYYSLGFELADYEQSRKRLHRPGQDRHVVLTHLLAEGTVDRAVYGVLRKRAQVVDAVIERLNTLR